MGMRFEDFRRTPLAVWRAYVDSYMEAQSASLRRLAWQVSWQLIGAGCKSKDVTVAKLLGENEPKQRSRRSRAEMPTRSQHDAIVAAKAKLAELKQGERNATR